MSLRPRSTSITCSARSFSSSSMAFSKRASSASSRPRGCVPAIGRYSSLRPVARTSISGDDPDIAYRAIIGLARAFGRDISRRNNVNLMPQMIERQQPVKEHEHAVGKRKIIFGMLADVLQLPHDIIAAITDGSGGEGGQSRHGCGTV